MIFWIVQRNNPEQDNSSIYSVYKTFQQILIIQKFRSANIQSCGVFLTQNIFQRPIDVREQEKWFNL